MPHEPINEIHSLIHLISVQQRKQNTNVARHQSLHSRADLMDLKVSHQKLQREARDSSAVEIPSTIHTNRMSITAKVTGSTFLVKTSNARRGFAQAIGHSVTTRKACKMSRHPALMDRCLQYRRRFTNQTFQGYAHPNLSREA